MRLRSIIANFVCLVIGAGVTAGIYYVIDNAKYDHIPKSEQTIPDNGGLEVTPSADAAQGMRLSVVSSAQNAESDGNSVTVTAVITPADASDKAVDWSYEWDKEAIYSGTTTYYSSTANKWYTDESGGTLTALMTSELAGIGVTESDYIKVEPASDGALTAKITALKGFGCPITLTCTSRANSDIKATCRLDYREKITGMTLTCSAAKDVNGHKTFTPTASTASQATIYAKIHSNSENATEGATLITEMTGEINFKSNGVSGQPSLKGSTWHEAGHILKTVPNAQALIGKTTNTQIMKLRLQYRGFAACFFQDTVNFDGTVNGYNNNYAVDDLGTVCDYLSKHSGICAFYVEAKFTPPEGSAEEAVTFTEYFYVNTANFPAANVAVAEIAIDPENVIL